MPFLEFRILNCLGSLGSPPVHLKRPLGASCGYRADPRADPRCLSRAHSWVLIILPLVFLSEPWLPLLPATSFYVRWNRS